ncbi:MAG: ABC transporter ATP-binding protein [Maribacter sp.]|nr:ABC transporter ATP-binding protein [Candidatus Brocadiaceae bacterium]MCP4978483.1 ABC transporter ATP-binding protein [Maribacter sp.]
MTRIEHIKVLWGLLNYHRAHFFACVFLTFGNSVIMGGALSCVLPAMSSLFSSAGGSTINRGGYFGKMLNLYNELIPDSDYKQLISVSILFVMMMINMTVQFVIVKVNSGLTVKITCDCREQIYNKIQQMKLSVIQQHHRGTFTQLLITETRSVYAVFKQVLSVIATFFNISIVLILIILLSWKLSAVLLIGSLFLVFINLSIVKRIKRIGIIALDLRAKLMNQATESIWGLKQSKLMQAGSVISKKLNTASMNSENIARRLMVKQGFQSFISGNFTIGIILAIILVWFFSPVFSEGIPQTAGILTFLVLMSRLAAYFANFSKGYGTIFSNLPAVLKVNEYLSGNIHSEKSGSYEPASLFNDKICLRNIHFKYSSDKPILYGINMEIKRGSYIGIAGRSGGGKSTMLNLLTRIYDPDEGDILIDERNIKEFRLSYLRSHIGMVSQDFFLFNASIRENLLLAMPSASEQDLWGALDKAGLSGFVNSSDQKLDTLVGNDGDKLSGGQRQRLCLATIFLRNPEVIILDEGTSSVDMETECHILTSLREMHSKGKTIISSSHKESSLADAEYIYQLTDGQLTLLTPSRI